MVRLPSRGSSGCKPARILSTAAIGLPLLLIALLTQRKGPLASIQPTTDHKHRATTLVCSTRPPEGFGADTWTLGPPKGICWISDAGIARNLIGGSFEKSIWWLREPGGRKSVDVWEEEMGWACRALMPGAPIEIHAPDYLSARKAAIRAGFVVTKATDHNVILAQKPAWVLNADDAHIPKEDKKEIPKEEKRDIPKEEEGWGGGGGEEELVDVGHLIGEDVVVDKKASSPRPRKPCANCKCGLADSKQTLTVNSGKSRKESVVDDEGRIKAPDEGGCGSCGLGDAYRCSGCPYRGLSSFKVENGNVILDADS